MTRFPKSAKSKSIIAELIARKFSFRCEKQDVHHWQNLSRIPVEGCNIPFPAPSKNNLYVVDDCFAWVEKWVLPHRNGNDAAEKIAKMAAKDRIDEKKDKLLDIRIKKLEGGLISRAAAERTTNGNIIKLLAFYRTTDEHLMPQESAIFLRSKGASDEIINAHGEWLTARMQSVTDQREQAAANAKREIAQELQRVEEETKAKAV